MVQSNERHDGFYPSILNRVKQLSTAQFCLLFTSVKEKYLCKVLENIDQDLGLLHKAPAHTIAILKLQSTNAVFNKLKIPCET